MTIGIIIFPEGKPNYKIQQEYKNWCWESLYVPGTAITYKVFGNRILFLYNEDATAFRLKFGL